MDVYIEYVILDNILMDALIVCLTLFSLGMRIKVWRVALASGIGTAFAVLLPLLKIHIVPLFLLRLICGVSMAALMYRYTGLKQFIKTLLLFFMYTFMLGGACFGAVFLLEKNFERAARLVYGGEIPIGACIAGAGFAVFALIVLARYLSKHRIVRNFTYGARITLCGNTVEIKGFLDTGNRLFDPLTNFPVMVVNMGVLCRLLGAESFEKLLMPVKTDGSKKLPKARYIPCSAFAGSSGKMMVIAPDKIEIYSKEKLNTIYDVMLGISYKNIGGEGCEALLHPAFVSEVLQP